MDESSTSIVYTNKARCRDCYRCLRACPVKAIEMHGGQARVVPERCIACGTCIRECPQGAKTYRRDLEKAMALVKNNPRVAASLAPSLASAWQEWGRTRLPSALRQLGFTWVGETAVGAYPAAHKTAEYVNEHPGKTHLCTACPAFVTYVEKYCPSQVANLVPVASPMQTHAAMIRKQNGADTKVVFFGPCVAKKAEAERNDIPEGVDCVLTFAELDEWLELENINLARCEESGFDEVPEGDARFFPVPGGLLRTAGLSTDALESSMRCIDGYDEIAGMLDSLHDNVQVSIVEPLFCRHGCIHGPGMPREDNAFSQHDALLQYAATQTGKDTKKEASEIMVSSPVFHASPIDIGNEFSEEEIRKVLAETGKASVEDQLDCGACGYPNCRAKAIGVLRGVAEPEMCLPFMRRLAERRTDRIIETSPNGIVVLDEDLQILSMNPSFRKMFVCGDAVLGKPISYLMDPEPFEKLATGDMQQIEQTQEHRNYKLICRQIAYSLPEDQQYVGIFVNVTTSMHNQEQLDELRTQTQVQARELLDHQVEMAQQMARLLGESTARGESLVRMLLKLAGEESSTVEERHWLKDIYTSK